MKGKKVWIVTHTWSDQEPTFTGHKEHLFAEEKDAKKYFDEIVFRMKAESWGGVISDGKLIDDRYVMLQGDKYFEISEDGNYSQNHESVAYHTITVE